MLYPFFLVFFLGVSVSAQFCNIDCPRPGGNCVDGNLANPEDCSSFCSCSGCIPWRLNCSAGQHYNPNLDQCVQESEYPCTVTTPAPTTPPPTEPIGTAVFAALLTELYNEDGVNPVIFDEVSVNFNNIYNISSGLLEIPINGFYFSTLSAGAPPFLPAELSLHRNFIKQTNLVRQDNLHINTDTFSRDFISYYEQGDILNIAMDTSRVNSDIAGLQTSWGVFSLTDLMNIDVLFSVGINLPYAPQLPLEYNQVLGNIGSGWDNNTKMFTAPIAGAYYLSMSAGSYFENNLAQWLFVYRAIDDRTDLLAGIYRNWNESGVEVVDTVGRSVMVYLNAGDMMYTQAVTEGYSNQSLQTYLSGFLYNPYHSLNLAWSVATEEVFDIRSVRLDPIPYEVVIVNEGNAYDPATYEVRCNQPGLYYVHVSAGAMPQLRVQMEVLRDGLVMGKLTRDSEHHTGFDTLSRSLLLECFPGSRLRVAVESLTGAWSNAARTTSFSGFFMYPLTSK